MKDSTIMGLHEKLVKAAKDAEVDLRKFYGGNKTAGIRARKAMQEVRKTARQIRDLIQSIKKRRKDDQES